MREEPQYRDLLGKIEELRRKVSEFELREQESARTRAKLQQLFDSSPQAIVLLDNSDRVVECNQQFCELFGYLPHEVENRPLNSLIVPAERAEEGATLSRKVLEGGTVEAEVIRRQKDGTPVDVRVVGYPIRVGGEQIGIWGVYNDIRAIRRDRHTNLPKRSVFLDRTAVELKRSLSSGTLVALLILDLDRFKDVNDSFGLPVGDALLRAVVERLKGTLRGIAAFSRLGPDEFGFLQTDISDVGSAVGLARRLLEAMRAPFELDGLRLHVTASVGISVSLWKVPGARELERQAQRALTLAKEADGDTYAVFTPRLDRATKERVVLGQELHDCWKRGELVLEYQPQIEASSSSVVGVEALLRWNHPVQGRLEPTHFIPIAESTGEIIPIGNWVLESAAAQAMEWQRTCGRAVPVAVNLSAVQFKDPELPRRVARALDASGLEAEQLELEITEGVFVGFDKLVDTAFAEFQRLGVGLCLDDFGRGYSSLEYLRRIPLRRVKIDRTFVLNITKAESDAQIVSAITALASRLGIDTIAEGVETKEQLDFLLSHGCTNVQGFYYSPALPADEVTEILSERSGLIQPSPGH